MNGRMVMAWAAICLTGVLGVGAASGLAGQSDLARAFELESAGRHEEAADAYRAALATNPANLGALLGLERVLPALGQLDSLVPYVDAALALQPNNRSIRALQLSVLGSLGNAPGIESAARQWLRVEPQSAEPYREWARALAKSGDTAGAQRVLADGVRQVGDASLSQDMAELSVRAGDWVPAAEHWLVAAKANATLLSSAVASLSNAPAFVRNRIVDALFGGRRDPLGGRMAAELLAGWNRPLDGWAILSAALPADRQAAVAVLRRFADRARLVRSNEGARARAYAFEEMSRRSSGPAAERFRVEAARAFVEAGDRDAAQRMLQRITTGPDDSGQSAAAAAVTLIGVSAESGRVNEAEKRFREWESRLSPDDVAMLRDRLAWAWIRRAELERASALLESDSSVATLAVRGWVALYRGNLGLAADYFRQAGPRAGSRSEATERTTMIALIQGIAADSLPLLGEALLELTRGDTAKAVRKLAEVGNSLPGTEGGAGVLTFAGRLAVEIGEGKRAEQLLVAAVEADSSGASAPAAHYYLARALEATDRPEAARRQLEHLILTYPSSAMLPLARRLLDQLQGRVPS